MKMKFNVSAAAASLAALLLAACTMYSTYDEELLEDKDDVIAIENESSDSEDIESSDNRDESSSSVEKEKSSSSENDGEKSSSSEEIMSSSSEDTDSSSAESSSSEEESSSSAPNDTIVVIPLKGPFINGKVTLAELISDNSLKSSGTSVTGSKISNGAFKVKKSALTSRFVLATAAGAYMNEATGAASSTKEITLNGIIDLEAQDTCYINVLTHMEHARVNKLTNNGKTSIEEAKNKAHKEILEIFHIDEFDGFRPFEKLSIFHSGKDDAALRAVSILLLSDYDDQNFSTAFTDITNDIADDGKWDEDNFRIHIADWSESVDLDKLNQNVKKVLSGQSSVEINERDYEALLGNFWANEFGLGKCDEDSLNITKNVTSEKSRYYSPNYAKNAPEDTDGNVRFICSNTVGYLQGFLPDNKYVWRKATDESEMDFARWTCKDGKITDDHGTEYKKQDTVKTPYTGKFGICDKAGLNQVFRYMNSTEDSLSKPCTAYMDGDYETASKEGIPYLCMGSLWKRAFVDKRDNQVYPVKVIGFQIWMDKNLNYDYNLSTNPGEETQNKASFCYKGEEENCEHSGRLYTWSAAVDSAALFSENCDGCGFGVYKSIYNTKRGVCPEGWHLPDFQDWVDLIGYEESQVYSSSIFSFEPAGLSLYVSDEATNKDADLNAAFWTATENDESSAFDAKLTCDVIATSPRGNTCQGEYKSGYPEIDKRSALSVRCISDMQHLHIEDPLYQ